jgi:hypothetical protein
MLPRDLQRRWICVDGIDPDGNPLLSRPIDDQPGNIR